MNNAKDTFDGVSDEALAAEIIRRKNERLKRQEEKAREKAALWLANIDALLAVEPEHGRTSCDDNNTSNGYANSMGYPRCVRCFLLRAKIEDHWDIAVALNLTLEPSRYDS